MNIRYKIVALHSESKIKTAFGIDRKVAVLREQYGGKAAHLLAMKGSGIPVPPFEVLDISLSQKLNDMQLEDGCTIQEKIIQIKELSNEDAIQAIADLKEELLSRSFQDKAERVIGVPIKEALEKLRSNASVKGPIIFRSSGPSEDDFRNASAGKYESVDLENNALSAYLEVVASSLQPTTLDTFPAMGVVCQEIVDCKLGGVIKTHTKVKRKEDDIEELLIEYGPGHPKLVVSGEEAVSPNAMKINKLTNEVTDSVQSEFSFGYYIDSQSQKVKRKEFDEKTKCPVLDPAIQNQLNEHIKTLENLFMCPLDIEFAVDQDDTVFILQARPITTLGGSILFEGFDYITENIETEVISEGYVSGTVILCTSLADIRLKQAQLNGNILAIPNYTIAVSTLLKDLDIELKGVIVSSGGQADHVGINTNEQGILCIKVTDLEVVATLQKQMTAAELDETGETDNRLYLAAGVDFETNKSVSGISCKSLDGYIASKTGHITFRTEVTRHIPELKERLINRSTAELEDPAEFLAQYKELTDINYTLLRCLGGEGSVISEVFLKNGIENIYIQKNREDILDTLVTEIKRFLEGMHLFFEKTEELDLCSKKASNSNGFQERTSSYKEGLRATIDKINTHLNDFRSLPFREQIEVLRDIKSLFFKPMKFEPESLNEFIIVLHKCFVNALTNKAVELAQVADTTKRGREVAVVYYPAKTEDKQSAYCENCFDFGGFQKIQARGSLLYLQDAVICNLELGEHTSQLAAYEDMGGGKGRGVEMAFSDQKHSFEGSLSGKYQRFLTTIKLIQHFGKGLQIDFEFNNMSNTLRVTVVGFKDAQSHQSFLKKMAIYQVVMLNLDRPLSEVSKHNLNEGNFLEAYETVVAREDKSISAETCHIIDCYLKMELEGKIQLLVNRKRMSRGFLDPFFDELVKDPNHYKIEANIMKLFLQKLSEFPDTLRRDPLCKNAAILKYKDELIDKDLSTDKKWVIKEGYQSAGSLNSLIEEVIKEFPNLMLEDADDGHH